MSEVESGSGAQFTPMTAREIAELQRLLRDPLNYPPELWQWIKAKMENDPPAMTWDSIVGFNKAAVAAVGPFPVAPTPAKAWTTGDTKVSAQTGNHVDPAGGTWYLADGTAIPAGETGLIALLGASFPDGRGRVVVVKGTHPDVAAIGANDGVALGSRRPKHNTSVLTNPTITRTANVTLADGTHVHATPYQGDNVGNGYQALWGANAAANSQSLSTGSASSNISVSQQPTFAASGGAYGPGGTTTVDQPAYVVAGNLFYHS